MLFLRESYFLKFSIKALCGTASLNHIQTIGCDSLLAPAGPSAISPQVQAVQPSAHCVWPRVPAWLWLKHDINWWGCFLMVGRKDINAVKQYDASDPKSPRLEKPQFRKAVPSN